MANFASYKFALLATAAIVAPAAATAQDPEQRVQVIGAMQDPEQRVQVIGARDDGAAQPAEVADASVPDLPVVYEDEDAAPAGTESGGGQTAPSPKG